MANTQALARQQIERLKNALDVDSVKKQFENTLRENAGPFIAGVIDLYGSDSKLQECDPAAVIREALKAATLKLPINKQLGFAYIVPYRKFPQFQLGYKGYIQLAMRTGQYKYLNADYLYEGMEIEHNPLTGAVKITGEPSGKITGYFCYMELLNGFTKTVYMNKKEVEAWGKRYSPSYSSKESAWKTNFDEMALKTVVRRLLSKYGILSIEMQQALVRDVDQEVEEEIAEHANREVIDITPKVSKKEAPIEPAPEDEEEKEAANIDNELEF